MDRLDPIFITGRLKDGGTRAKHGFGQNFLIDRNVLTAVLEGGDVQPNDIVIEIGPGLGGLTVALLERAAVVHAFEADPAMLSVLQEDFAEEIMAGKLVLHPGDAITTLPALLATLTTYKVVANIPYQITTPLFQVLYEAESPAPIRASLLVQREVAERLAAPAKSGERSYLSVLAQLYTTLKIAMIVPATAFLPSPQVQSAVLVLVKREQLPIESVRPFLKFVKMSFLQRRKQLKNVLAGMRGTSVAEMQTRLESLDFPATVRAQELAEADWIKLYNANI